MTILVNIDVPDLSHAVSFYTDAFRLKGKRSIGPAAVELEGWPVAIFLLERKAGTVGVGTKRRSYERHWTPVHLDIAVEDVADSVSRAVAAGGRLEREISDEVWGKIVGLSDPFGNGFCLIQFQNRGYDEISAPSGD